MLYELVAVHYNIIPVLYWITEFHELYIRVGMQCIASLQVNFLTITGFSLF